MHFFNNIYNKAILIWLRFYGHMVRMDQGRLNKRVFDRSGEYKGVGGYVKRMREETEKLKIKRNQGSCGK